MHDGLVILDGGVEGFPSTEGCIRVLRDLLAEWRGPVEFVTLREKKIAFCTGCFGCWIKTPGMCVLRDDSEAITRAASAAEWMLLLTPVVCGGYSSVLKRQLDRMIGINLPFFMQKEGETHHVPRFARYPSWMVVGLQAERDEEESAIFEELVQRNALNVHAPKTMVRVFGGGDRGEAVRDGLQEMLRKGGVMS